MSKENDNAAYQKVVEEVTLVIPPGNEMIMQSKAKGKHLDKSCI